MSVRVHINIAQGSAVRNLTIDRVATGPDEDGVNIHSVTLDNGFSERGTSHFEHNYGDDVLTLISKAIEALRAEGVTQA